MIRGGSMKNKNKKLIYLMRILITALGAGLGAMIGSLAWPLVERVFPRIAGKL